MLSGIRTRNSGLDGEHDADTRCRRHALVKKVVVIAKRRYVDREPGMAGNDAEMSSTTSPVALVIVNTSRHIEFSSVSHEEVRPRVDTDFWRPSY